MLPSFPGLDAIGQALEHGVAVTGVTIHYVDEGIDSGPIILQRAVPIPPDRNREALEAAIHSTEHALLPQAIAMIAAGRVSVAPGSRVVRIEAEDLDWPRWASRPKSIRAGRRPWAAGSGFAGR